MSARPRALVAASGRRELQLLTSVLDDEGLTTVAVVASRSLKPRAPMGDGFVAGLPSFLDALPDDVDLLLPSSAEALAVYLSGCALDLIVVFGFDWRLPGAVLGLPRFGAVNVHLSALPKYRGPSPVPWAIRNGDRYLGASVHRMNEDIDAGPVLGQVEDVEIPAHPTPDSLWPAVSRSVARLLRDTLPKALAGDRGEAQDAGRATYAGFPPDDWYVIDWGDPREDVHNKIRFVNYVRGGEGADVELDGARLTVFETSLHGPHGRRVACADGPLWITSWAATR